MKKKLFFVGIAAVLAVFSSCRKEDQYLLDKGFRVEGSVSPGLELPVSNGSVNFGELLDKFGESFAEYITDDEVITLHYTYDTLSYIDIGEAITTPSPAPARKPGIPAKDQVFTPVQDTVFSYEFPISFFDNVDLLSEADSINELLLEGYAKVWAECPPGVQSDLQFVRADIDQLKVDYTKHDGLPGNTIDFPGAEIHIVDLTDHNNTLPIPQKNLASIFNDMPSYITVSFHMTISVDEDGFLSSNISNINSFEELLDSLGMTRLYYATHVDLTFPLELKIGALSYSYDIDLQSGDSESSSTSVFDEIDSALNNLLGEGSANIDSAALAVIFKFDNGIPLDIILDATALDANEQPIFTLFTDQTIHSAETAPMPGNPNVSQAVAPTRSELEAQLNLAQARQFLSAQTLRLKLGLKTIGDDYKAIRRSDELGIKMYLRLNPNIKISWNIPGLENGLGHISF